MRDGDKDALGADIRLLGGMLGEIIRQVAGGDAFELEEHLRGRAKELRTSHSVDEARRLRDELERLELADLRTLIRAFTVFFDLVNLAEQRARVRVLRARTRQADPLPIAESVESALRQLRLRGVSPQQLHDLMAQALLAPTFTAHPSEARRRTVLDKLRHLNEQMDRLERHDLLPRERDRCRQGMMEEVESLWQSDLVRVLRPTVLDEVRQGLEVVEGTLLDVVPRLYRDLEAALEKVYPEVAGRVPALVRFRSWIGGDRDGNPNVDHTATAKAVAMHQQAILAVYLERMADLTRRLSQTSQFAPPSDDLAASLKADRDALPELAGQPGHEPYRLKCRAITARLERTRKYLTAVDLRWSEEPAAPPPGVYLGGHELHDDLRLMI
ncbi:MAG: phosphoenolpyruvate carboxylase, partial [Gemmataceae bacterium]